MKQIDKHRFETLSMLTVDKGQLDVTFIPVKNRPDWVLPSVLIIHVDKFTEIQDIIVWQDQNIAAYSLLSADQRPNKVVILEGETVNHRIALLIHGELNQQQVKISDAKDIDYYEDLNINPTSSSLDLEKPENTYNFDISNNISFIFQMIEIDGRVYSVPDLDVLSDYLSSYK